MTMASAVTEPDRTISFMADLPERERRSLQSSIDSFVVQHSANNRPVVLVSSGGTVCDLEVNSVRCLDNFSTGLRGATCVEEFLKRGYAVVHLWRAGSASPFARVLSQVLTDSPANHPLDVESLGRLFATDLDQEEEYVKAVLQQDPFLSDPSVSVNGEHHSAREELALHRSITHNNRIQRALRERAAALSDKRLLTIPFRTVEEYLARLELISCSLHDCAPSITMFFLAAAVSDFYIPRSQRTEHKIQSGADGLTLHLEPVPKTIGSLRRHWAPEAFVVSFKLETDPKLLREKSERAVGRYGCHLVVGNLLQTRHDKVWLLQPPDQRNQNPTDASTWPLTEISRPISDDPDALESKLVDAVVQAHFEYISWHLNTNESSIEAAIEAKTRLEERKRRVHRMEMWEQAKGMCLEAVGVVLALVLSYAVNTVLQRRLRSG